ncbi:MAG: N-acyl homoserine lactonase family protein [Pseudomonadota bacterium]
MSGPYEIYAIRYGKAVRKRSESFLGGDPNDGPMPMAYYVWLIRSDTHAVVVDTGFDPAVAHARGREYIIAPDDALRELGTAPEDVRHVILTHLHYDHGGNHHLFPTATFHIQAAEMAYTTGSWMTHPRLRAGYSAADVKAMIDRLFDDRVRFHKGRSTVLPGIEVIHMGGHSAGLQSVIVDTARGPVVLASDAMVFYESLETERPFPACFHVGEEMSGYRTLLEIAGTPDAIIPGHDTMVMARFPAAVSNIAWRVDVAPLA